MSLYINDIVDSAIDYLGYEGSRNVTSTWDTTSNTIFIKVGSLYRTDYYYGDVYFSDLNLTVSFDENGWLDQYSVTGFEEGVYFHEKGLHNIPFSKRSDIESYYLQIEAREQAEVLITQEKNTIRSTFDAQYYLDKYPEVKAAYGNHLESALDHYVRWGKAEGRTDLNEAEALITQEKNELRNTFDASYYLEKYPDVKDVYGNDNELALDHYVRSGKAEGRSDANESELSLRDSFTAFSTNSKIIDGGSGIDTVTCLASSDSVTFSLEKGASLYGGQSSSNSENNQNSLVISQTITETIYGGKNVSTTTSSSVQSETLTNIERLHFTDKGYGLDIEGNTGVAAKVIISAFGAEKLPSKMSSLLTIVDNGKTIDGISNYVIQRGLIENAIDSSTNGSFVDHVYENVVGIAPSSADHDTYTALLDNGTYTKSSLLALAANTTLTADIMTANLVDLIGVAGSADGEILALQYDLGLG
jgi:hypothetical protein